MYNFDKLKEELLAELHKISPINDSTKKTIDKVALKCNLISDSIHDSFTLLNETSRIAKIGGWTFDIDAKKLEWSFETYNIHDVDSDFPLSLENAFNFYSEKSQKLIHQSINNLLTNGDSFEIELEIVSQKGNRKWLNSIGKPKYVNNKLVGIIGTNQDITENKLREKALIESNEKYKYLSIQLEAILDHIPGLVFYKDTKNNFIRVNKYVANAYELDKKELEGKNLSDLHSKEDAEKYHKDDLVVIDSGIAKLNIVELWDTPLGLKWVNTSKIPFVNESGEIIGIIGISFDITELRTTEFLKQKNKEMEILNKYLIKVREDERLKISREIHDELGQAMTILKIDLSWIRENIDNKESSIHKINKLIEIISNTLKCVQRISSDLRPRMLDDLGLVSAIEWYSSEFEERTGIKCILSLDNGIFSNTQINLSLFRILQESLTNIARHANASLVNIQLSCKENTIVLIIDDNGIGIPFEKIESKDSTGLMGMRERVRQFGGSFEIVRKEDSGTKVITILPA